MKILIAEDEAPKLAHLRAFVDGNLSGTIFTARSVRSAIDSIEQNCPDLILLDMSLPTFEVSPGEPGGRPQGWGGAEVLRYMEYLGLSSSVIVVTQYEAFPTPGGSVDLSHLSDELRSEHPTLFKGVVHYTALNEEWHAALLRIISTCDLRPS
jgi:CheY-like chemotaxis protein